MNKDIFGTKTPYILIVDDVLKNLQVLGTILEEEDFEVAVANNGFEALEIVENDKPDLILLDITMPDMDGYEVCRRLKANEDTKNIPVIFLTARTETEDIVKGFEMGGVDYVTKPFKKEELLSRIETHLELTFTRNQLELQNIELVKLNQQKNEFLGIAAHDLKNPLSAIKGLSELVMRFRSQIDEEELLDIAKQIHDSSEFMFKLIVDLLDINAIEDGKIQLDYEEIPIDSILQNLSKRFENQAKTKDISLIINNSCGDRTIIGDNFRIQQVLDNLLSNAIKFSPFNLRIWLNATISHSNHLILEIKDEGPGLSGEDKKKLFGKFARLSARPTNQESSTGLGLSIVKKIVELMKGEIWCESELGKGASFKVKLPFIEF